MFVFVVYVGVMEMRMKNAMVFVKMSVRRGRVCALRFIVPVLVVHVVVSVKVLVADIFVFMAVLVVFGKVAVNPRRHQ